MARSTKRVQIPVAGNGTVDEATGLVIPAPEGAGTEKMVRLTITPPKLEVLRVRIRGTAPLVINRFSQKAITMIHETQAAGSQSKKGRKREPKDFEACFEGAKHVSTTGWLGFCASAVRCACVSACRLCGFKMTLAKLSVFVLADGFDTVDFVPLVKITKGEPRYSELPVRNESGVVDLRARPMWTPGWEAILSVQYDADQFSAQDSINLLHRVGSQVGIGEGRPDSPNSVGVGWGTFAISDIVNEPQEADPLS